MSHMFRQSAVCEVKVQKTCVVTNTNSEKCSSAQSLFPSPACESLQRPFEVVVMAFPLCPVVLINTLGELLLSWFAGSLAAESKHNQSRLNITQGSH